MESREGRQGRQAAAGGALVQCEIEV